MMTNVNTQMEILRNLRKAGFIIEMDDFGSGYSSLNLLREMPVDVLKIDMVFLQQANQNARAKAIVEDIIGLSSRLGMASLTEGVETQAQYDSLMKMGCQMYQGYYFAKPMPEGDFDQLLSRERQRH
jgi:EAL domain-containing protein (putative c-di-GMP-specific phosphodiesterase class I)